MRRRSFAGVVLTAASLVVIGGTTAHASDRDPVESAVDEALSEVGQEISASEAPLAGAQERDGVAVAPTLAGPVAIRPHDIGNSSIRLREDGVQVLTVLREGTSSAVFSVDVPEGARLRQEGSLVTVAREAEGVVLTFAEFDEPWAVDADGTTLPTTYEVSGDRIVQTVDTSDATFPVVADPRLTPRASGANGAGLYLSMYGSEMKAVVNGLISVGGVGAIVGCTVGRLPAPVAKIVQLACAAVGLPTLKSLLNAMVANTNSGGIVSGACYEAKVLPQGPFRRVAAARC